jgi:hypothetical protein
MHRVSTSITKLNEINERKRQFDSTFKEMLAYLGDPRLEETYAKLALTYS